MIRKLQKRFTLITMLVLSAIFIIVFFAIFISVSAANTRQAERILRQIASEQFQPFQPSAAMQIPPAEGEAPPVGGGQWGPQIVPDEDLVRLTRSFSVFVDEEGNLYDLRSSMEEALSEEQAYTLAEQALQTGKQSGRIGNMQYLVVQEPEGTQIVFVDRSQEINVLGGFFIVMIIVGGCALFGLYFVVRALSAFAIKPAKEAFEKQRRFISDASHELKTPVSTILANTDVLASDIGDNKWLENIKEQSQRMDALVKQLLSLARADEAAPGMQHTRFDLSAAVLSSVLPFESVAYEEDRLFTYDIAEGIHYVGDEPSIKQMVSILVDNAIKHSQPGGQVRVSLAMRKGRPQIEVFNTGKGIEKEQQEKIFERFYRVDDARDSSQGSYGLGLSIARAAATANKGKITVDSKVGEWALFIVTLQ